MLHNKYLLPIVLLGLTAIGGTTIQAQQSDQRRPLSDKAIRKGLSEHMKFDDVLHRRQIDVEVKEGIALLGGSVASLFEKDRAVAIAETIRGVRAVVDQITLEHPQRNDKEIRADVIAALQADPATEASDVRVSAENSSIVLEGTSDSHIEKILCGQAARSVRGVRRVANNIKVKVDHNRPDDELRTEIIRRLQSDLWVTDDLIRVEVQDGKVTLTGVVGSVSQRNCAELDSWVPGIRNVDVRQLEVDARTVDQSRRQREVKTPRFGETVAAVRDALKYDPRIRADGIEVSLEAGVIRLMGQVNTLAAKRAAEKNAERTRSVARVDNQLVVIATSKEQETKAAAAVRGALARDIYVSDGDIEVTVNDGVAKLSGTINSRTGQQRAETIAESVSGITSVDNQLKVADNSKPPTDLQIKYGVKNRLYWSSFINDRSVTVIVEDGRVSLTGMVDDQVALQEATRAAREAGATEIDNRLLVRDTE